MVSNPGFPLVSQARDNGLWLLIRVRLSPGYGQRKVAQFPRKGKHMAAMKPRTGDGPLEVTKEGRGIVLRMPLEGGGRLVVEMTPDEAAALRDAIQGCDGVPRS